MEKKVPDYSRLKALLELQESFPIDYTLKFIGKNSEQFQASVRSFEEAHPTLGTGSRRMSAKGNHIALTYVFSARSADHVIAVLEQVSRIDDLLVIL